MIKNAQEIDDIRKNVQAAAQLEIELGSEQRGEEADDGEAGEVGGGDGFLSAELRTWLLYLVGLLVYAHIGVLAYAFLEDEWSYWTSLYFSFTIISTVGYGCIGPSSMGSRVFTMFYAVASIPFVSALLAGVWAPLVETPYDWLIVRAKKRYPFLRSDGDDPSRPVSSRYFYFRGIMPVFMYVHNFTCILTALLTFAAGKLPGVKFWNTLVGAKPSWLGSSGEGSISPFDSLYLTVITSSTVGFGDVCPASDKARVFTVFAAGYGLAVLSFFVTKCGEVSSAKTNKQTNKQTNKAGTSPCVVCDHCATFLLSAQRFL